jgi:hypothetical protein
MDMDEDMSRLSADDSRLSDTNSLMVSFNTNVFTYIFMYYLILI